VAVARGVWEWLWLAMADCRAGTRVPRYGVWCSPCSFSGSARMIQIKNLIHYHSRLKLQLHGTFSTGIRNKPTSKIREHAQCTGQVQVHCQCPFVEISLLLEPDVSLLADRALPVARLCPKNRSTLAPARGYGLLPTNLLAVASILSTSIQHA